MRWLIKINFVCFVVFIQKINATAALIMEAVKVVQFVLLKAVVLHTVNAPVDTDIKEESVKVSKKNL